jgi:hypothetical protein
MGHQRVIRHEVMPERPQHDIDETPFHRYIFADGTVCTEFYRLPTGYLLRFPDLADFEVTTDGTEVISHPASGVDKTTIEHLYVNQLVPLALSRQGRPSFHASVVTVPGGAVAFLGESGAGKSTLAASYALSGAAFLTDDALLVEESDGKCWAVPSHASIRLWEDSKEALVAADAPQADPISYSSKARLLAGEALTYCDEKKPLLAAFVLQPGEGSEVLVQPLTGLDRYMGWLKHSFLLDIEDHDLLANHFKWTHSISDAVPTFALEIPRDYGILPLVREAVRRQLTNNED